MDYTQEQRDIAHAAAKECQQAIDMFKARYDKAACKKRGFKDWRDALAAAWHNGWDGDVPQPETGGNLRYLRNNYGYIWLAEQEA